MAQVVKDFFVYTTGRTSLAPAAQTTINIPIQADADFEIVKLTYYADVAGAAQTRATQVVPNINLTITDTGSGRQLMNTAIPLYALFGIAGEPFILPIPKIIRARSNIQIVATSFEAANTDLFSLNFIGNKIFAYGA